MPILKGGGAQILPILKGGYTDSANSKLVYCVSTY